MSTLSLNDFRLAFPEFTESAYPDHAVLFRLGLAELFFDTVRWGEAVRPHAIGLYVAHFLKLAGSSASGGDGSVSGNGDGIAAGRSVDGVSVSLDTGSGTYYSAGHWNLTVYGKELYSLMKIFGAGAVQI